MGEKTHTSKGDEIKRTDEKVDLRKHRKRITTNEEIAEIMENRKKFQQELLKEKMEKISKEQKKNSDVDIETNKKKIKLNNIGFPNNDPYGLSEAWWKIFTKPKVE